MSKGSKDTRSPSLKKRRKNYAAIDWTKKKKKEKKA